ncbi:MAG: aldehyde dehydrogenase family protein [Deltaproteobacteria bacterium]|nr:aldehyde dehydrogenase family protein [Deltaproteobacteria bacterium]NIS76518.1 aldehyde dehydrogenase family protein [Deltaproteobacteria bacterium]
MINRALYVDGKWVRKGKKFDVINPYDGSVVGRVPSATPDMVSDAIGAAHGSRAVMADMPLHERARILSRTSELLEKKKEAFARMIALEAGKAWKYAIGEVERAIQTFRFAAVEALKIHGETIPMSAAAGAETRVGYYDRFPIGVIASISPFNFPLNLVAHKIAPAIAAGNTVVHKPASVTPITSIMLVEVLLEAGLPPKAINLVAGSGSVVGDALVTDDRVAMVTFTGSPTVGWAIKERCGKKKAILELGSNCGIVVEDDADLDWAIPRSIVGAFAYSGQVCISLQRIYVNKKIYRRFVKEFVERAKKLRMGDPLSPRTDVNPMITLEEAKRVEGWIKEARDEGARVETGGVRRGNVIRPTVLTRVDRTMKVSCLEVFAPVAVIDSYETFEEGIEKLNDSIYGLQAGVFTKDVDKAMYAFKKLDVGGVMINDVPTFRVDHMPYGGVKNSGLGREGLKFTIEEMTEIKLVVFNV